MNNYVSNTTVPQIAQRIMSANSVMITTHVKPDGDAMGACLGLARALQSKGKQAHIFLMGPIDANLIVIAGETPFRRVDHEMPRDDYDLCVVLDTGSWSQLDILTPWLGTRREKIIGIDHHTQGDDVTAMRLVEPQAVSTTAVLVPILDEVQCELTGGVGGVAEALFVGLATDSGWFRYGNAGAGAFALAARLLLCGIDKPRLYQILEETFGPQRLALEAKALASLEFARNGAIAIQTLRIEDFKSTGASPEDLTGLVNTPMTVGMVRASILISQTAPGQTKISFRSKPPAPGAAADDFIDVNKLAQEFGGGGHVHAAGAKIQMDIDEAKAAVLAVLE